MLTTPLCHPPPPPPPHTPIPGTPLTHPGCCFWQWGAAHPPQEPVTRVFSTCEAFQWQKQFGVTEGHAVPDMAVTAGMSSMRSQQQKTCWQLGGQGCQRGKGVRCPALPSFTVPEGIYMSSSSLISAPRLWRTGPATPGMATMMASSSTGLSRASCCRLGTPWVCCPLPSQTFHLMLLLGNTLLLTKCYCHGQAGRCLMVMTGSPTSPQLSSFQPEADCKKHCHTFFHMLHHAPSSVI